MAERECQGQYRKQPDEKRRASGQQARERESQVERLLDRQGPEMVGLVSPADEVADVQE